MNLAKPFVARLTWNELVAGRTSLGEDRPTGLGLLELFRDERFGGALHGVVFRRRAHARGWTCREFRDRRCWAAEPAASEYLDREGALATRADDRHTPLPKQAGRFSPERGVQSGCARSWWWYSREPE